MRRLLVPAAVVGLLAVSGSPAAHAVLVPDAASAQAVKQCGVLYSTPGNDPSGLWQRMNDPNGPVVIIKFEPVPEDGSGTRTGVPQEGDDIRIVWDHTHDIKLDGITSGPCEALYHELQHAADDADEIPDEVLDETCNGVRNAEWRAIKAQNALRRALGLKDMRPASHGKSLGGFDSFEDCKKGNEKPKGPAKNAGNNAYGDPHITTTDGLQYDLQQVGEFTAFTSDDDGAPRVQVRTAAVPGSTFASLISGAAAGLGDQRIAFVLDEGRLSITHGARNDTVAVDRGAEQDLGDGMTLAAAEPDANFVGSAYTVRWADGSELAVDDGGFWGLRVSFAPSGQAKGATPRGLFGTFDGDPADDLTRPDGTVVPVESSDAVIRADFGDAWRISQSDSLFPYGPGQSTATMTDHRFPTGELNLSAADNDRGRQVCEDAGVTGEAFLAACVFDVVVTGNPALAYTSAQVSRESVVTAVAGEPANARGFGPGLAVSGTVRAGQPVDYEFTARAGEVAYLRSACTATGSEVRYTVSPVSGSMSEPIGVVDGCTDLGRVAFATDGTYRLAVTGEGRYGIRWQATPGDQRRALNPSTPNAGHVAAGTRHHLRFTAGPGQQWTFTPNAGCTQVDGFDWSVVDATGALNDRGIIEGCTAIGPLTLAPGPYDLSIVAAGTDANYLFTARSN